MLTHFFNTPMTDILLVVAEYAASIAGIGLVTKWLVNAAKEAGLPSRFARVAALAIGAGVGFAYLSAVSEVHSAVAILVGLFGGATAIGDYDASKVLAKPEDPQFTVKNLPDNQGDGQ